VGGIEHRMAAPLQCIGAAVESQIALPAEVDVRRSTQCREAKAKPAHREFGRPEAACWYSSIRHGYDSGGAFVSRANTRRHRGSHPGSLSNGDYVFASPNFLSRPYSCIREIPSCLAAFTLLPSAFRIACTTARLSRALRSVALTGGVLSLGCRERSSA